MAKIILALLALSSPLFFAAALADDQLVASATHTAEYGDGKRAIGVWYATFFLGDPEEPSTALLQATITFNADRTFLFDSTSETGEHPFLPGDKTPVHGVWERRGNTVEVKGVWFDEFGGGFGFSVGRLVSHLEFDGQDMLIGEANVDFLPCAQGPTNCPDPTQGEFLALGDDAGPVTLRRFDP